MDIKLIYKSPKQLFNYPKNNKKHPKKQIDRLAQSIDEFGFNQPVLLDSNDVIVCGHARVEASLQLGLEQIPCIYVDHLTDKQIRQYRILDNKIAMESEWDFESLAPELAELEALGVDMQMGGLDELEKMFPIEDPEVTEDEFTANENAETFIKLGDLIELGRHRVLCGDSTDSEQVSELMNGKIANLMVTDPPYGVEYDPNWRNEAAKAGYISYAASSIGIVTNDERVDWTEAYRNINAQVAYVWHGDRHAKTVAQNLEDCDYEIVCQIIWAKPMFAISRGDYHWQHEPCWYVVKKGQKHNWQGARDQATLWKIERGCKEKTGHGTEKPIECMARPIKNNSAQNDIVADPFLGSGTTLIACEQLNRTCYGMEISPKYCQVIIDRYFKYCETNNKPFECKINGEKYTPLEKE